MKKYMSLIFDDGPNIFMNKMVDKFIEHGFRCAFAVIGNEINNDSLCMIKYAIDNNFQIISHCQSHVSLWKFATNKEVEDEFLLPIHTVKDSLGYTIKMARLPFLSGDKRIFECAKKLELPLLGQGIRSGKDWSSESTPDSIAEAVISSSTNGAIGCLHVCENTCTALDIILPKLKESGFCLVTPDEIFEQFSIKDIPLGVQIDNVLTYKKEI